MSDSLHLKSRYDGLVALDKNMKNGYDKILQSTLNKVLFEMKISDPFFRKFHDESIFRGGYFDGLPIVGNQHQEFEVNLVFNIAYHGFAVKSEDSPQSQYMEFIKTSKNMGTFEEIVEDERISPGKMELVMKKAARKCLTKLGNKITLDTGVVMNVTESDKSPYKLLLQPTSGRYQNTLKVKLVPSLKCHYQTFHPNIKHHHTKLYKMVGNVYPMIVTARPDLDRRCLEVDFCESSAKILNSKASAAMAVRLLYQEVARIEGIDMEIMRFVIKTAALHELLDNNDKQHWEEDKLHLRMADIRKSLRKHMESGHMSHVFFPSVNILNNVNFIIDKIEEILESENMDAILERLVLPCAANQCSQGFSTFEETVEHARQVHGYKYREQKNVSCGTDECKKKFLTVKGAQDHAVSVHSSATVARKGKSFPCVAKECSRLFTTSERSAEHAKMAHGYGYEKNIYRE